MSPWRGSAAAVGGHYPAITPGSYGERIALADQPVACVRGDTGRK